MSNPCEQALKGTHQEAVAEAANIRQVLTSYGKTGHKEADKHQLNYCSNILRSICIVVTTPRGNHYDVYCNIFENILAPCLKPAASPAHWGKFLENWRYLHHSLVNKKLYAESSRIYASLAAQADKLQNETDFKPILETYCLHLLSQRARMQCDPVAAQREISHVVDALTALFVDMLQSNVKLNFIYAGIIDIFVQCWCKQSPNTLEFLAKSLPTEKTHRMYAALFELLEEMKMPLLEPKEVELHCRRHLEAFVSFMHLDVACKLQHQVALQHLRVCGELQSDKSIDYMLNLLYYFVKFCYSQMKFNNFSHAYVELCDKFNNFSAKYSEVLQQHQWFMDVVVALSLLLAQTLQRPSTCFKVFWQQMNTIDCYAAHFELILCCIKLAPHISESKLASWNCCSSVRKHTILSYAQSALGTYSYFVQNVVEPGQHEAKKLEQLNKTFTTIVRHAVNVINSMSCITDATTTAPSAVPCNANSRTQSNDSKAFYARFAQLTLDVRSAAHASFCVTLADTLQNLQAKFAPSDWTLLLRRIYKMAEVSADPVLTAELHSCYIAALLQQPPEPNLLLLRQQISIFHTNPRENCLLERLARCRSPFKPTLQPTQRRLLHWLETQHLFKYQKASPALQRSLLDHCETLYDRVLVAHAAKMNAADAGLATIGDTLRRKAAIKGVALSRLEQLTLGHVSAELLHAQNDVQRKIIKFESKDCVEDKLDELLQRKEFLAINVATEMEAISLAVEALHAFMAFYNRADLQHISSDEAYIDWEYIVEQLTSLALYLQFSGYLAQATDAWLLHYRICNTIADCHNSLRALSYFCEHVDQLDSPDAAFPLELQHEVASKLPTVVQCLQTLSTLSLRKQTFLLLCVCQLGYYYAHQRNFSYAHMLLLFVRQQHQGLPERRGKYDLVASTMEVVRIRILWKHADHLRSAANATGDVGQAALLQPCLLRQIESTLDSFREFVYISSSDTLPYMILLINLTQQAAECTANRLYDYHINSIFVSVLKEALHSGKALRTVQILTMWMWTNLQKEYVAKAQTKLKLIECVLGVTKPQQLLQLAATKSQPILSKAASLPEPPIEALSLQLNGVSVEAMRKLVPLQKSPIKIQKRALSIEASNSDLQRFLVARCGHNDVLRQDKLLRWAYFAVGCLNARLYFLIDEHASLEDFYEQSLLWLSQQQPTLYQRQYQNFQLLCVQHYVNYLRSRGKFEQAIGVLETALQKCKQLSRHVDGVYRLNFLLQLRATQQQLAGRQLSPKEKSDRSRLRRALEFNASFNASFEARTATKVKSKDMYKLYASTTKKAVPATGVKKKPFNIYLSDDEADEPLSRKQLFGKKLGGSGGSSQGSQDSPSGIVVAQQPVIDLYKSTKEDDFNLCQAIELIDLADSPPTVKTTSGKQRKQTAASLSVKEQQPQPLVAVNSLQCVTEVLPSTTPARPLRKRAPLAGSKSAKASVTSILASGSTSAIVQRSARRPARTCADLIAELADVGNSASPDLGSTVPAQQEVGNDKAAEIELLQQMQALEIATPAKAKTPTQRARTHRPPLLKQSCLGASSAGSSPTVAEIIHASAAATQPSKGRSRAKASAAKNTEATTTAATLPERRLRGRPRKQLAAENNENEAPATPPVSSSGGVTRRRQRR